MYIFLKKDGIAIVCVTCVCRPPVIYFASDFFVTETERERDESGERAKQTTEIEIERERETVIYLIMSKSICCTERPLTHGHIYINRKQLEWNVIEMRLRSGDLAQREGRSKETIMVDRKDG